MALLAGAIRHAVVFTLEHPEGSEAESYKAHPDHVRFVEERWVREVEDFLEVDYRAR